MHHRYLLIYRFLLVNMVAAAGLAMAWVHGWIDRVLASDSSRISVLIFAVFLVGLTLCAWRIIQISDGLNDLKRAQPAKNGRVAAYLATLTRVPEARRPVVAEGLKAKLYARASNVRYIADSLVLLGLIGTVVGFIVALSGVDQNRVADVSAVGPMVAQLLDGMAIALWTTLVGSILHIWLRLNYQILAGGTVTLVADLVARGEGDAV
ncbi:MotA/TolQ/ExbB proton channel family protein [Tistrella mobilis]|jgi:biopolymer transport protein ExbB/TolQ|uniref:MotA/TolQ/ExbB proton channel domain-containing protein n=2 Tax=Tistrella mobilis TaxID=171437 RepID=A0A162L8S9_9PROT|nr:MULTISPECIES: MotA/TolQ/ExbB proton channel family protein [Tistrella]KYO53813.1 hypothetical protein AUP44_26165 [Tistrella mobilis]